MVKIILEGNRREVYAMGFDLMEARNKNGELLFSDIKETEGSTFREEDPLDSPGTMKSETVGRRQSLTGLPPMAYNSYN